VQWNVANKWCADKGLHLVSPKTLSEKEGAAAELIKRGYRKKENDYRLRKITNTEHFFAGGYNFWLSASDVGQSPGKFHWSDGTMLDKSVWEGGQPDDFGAGKETCVYFNTQYSKLRDFSCSNTFYTLCEMPSTLNSCSTT
jgi:Lectin C-type domain